MCHARRPNWKSELFGLKMSPCTTRVHESVQIHEGVFSDVLGRIEADVQKSEVCQDHSIHIEHLQRAGSNHP